MLRLSLAKVVGHVEDTLAGEPDGRATITPISKKVNEILTINAMRVDHQAISAPEKSESVCCASIGKPWSSQPEPPESIEFPIPDVKAALSGFVGGLEKRLSSLTQGAFGNLIRHSDSEASADRREARIEVIRADPATFEQLPPAPQPGVLSYTDWRNAYFDEETCTPRLGIPIPDFLSKPTTAGPRAPAGVAPPHAPPAQVLEESPAVRSHLLRLVDPDAACNAEDASSRKTDLLTEADFWSRYYYRLWLLDVAEMRRQQIAGSLAGATDAEGSTSAKSYGESVADDIWPVLDDNLEVTTEEPTEDEPATPTSLGRTPVAGGFTFRELKDATPEPAEAPTHQTEVPKPDCGLPPPKPTPSATEPQEKKSGPSSFTASSPASSIVVLNSDDAEDADEGGQYHPQLLPTESPSTTQTDQPADGDWDDYDMALTDQDIRDAEKEMQSRLQAESSTTEASGDVSDWEKWT
ncbi:hypothetical protein SprV_0502013300 [Sparganum proliferum]